MADIRVSADAQADLADILATSLERWGEAGSARYRSLLVAALRELGADPERPMSKDRRDLAPRLRSFHLRYIRRDHGVKEPVHVIYYRRLRASILIVRVLHERMDAGGHVATTARRARPTRRR